MGSFLVVRSNYLNQCWLVIKKAVCHSSEGYSMQISQVTTLYNDFDNNSYEIIATSPIGQYIKQSNL